MKPKQSVQKQLRNTHHCSFCVNQSTALDYKNTKLLQRYISSYGKIVSSKRSHVCQFHQRKLSDAIKRARIMALLPFAVI